jgi:hypothetical protein
MRIKELNILSFVFAITNLVILFLFNYVTLRILTVSEGVKFTDAAKLSPILLLVVLIPVFIILMPYSKDFLGKYEPILAIALPIVGILLHVMLFFLFKGKYISEVLKIGESFGLETSMSVITQLRAGIGYYLVLVTYLLMFIVNVITAKGIDLGSKRLNNFVNKVADMALHLRNREAK